MLVLKSHYAFGSRFLIWVENLPDCLKMKGWFF